MMILIISGLIFASLTYYIEMVSGLSLSLSPSSLTGKRLWLH